MVGEMSFKGLHKLFEEPHSKWRSSFFVRNSPGFLVFRICTSDISLYRAPVMQMGAIWK